MLFDRFLETEPLNLALVAAKRWSRIWRSFSCTRDLRENPLELENCRPIRRLLLSAGLGGSSGSGLLRAAVGQPTASQRSLG